MGGVKTLLVLAVAAFHLAIVSRGIRSNELVTDTHPFGCLLEKRRLVLVCGKAVCKLTAIVSLNALDLDAPAFEPGDGLFKKIGRRIRRLFSVGSQIPQAGEFVNGCVLEQTLTAVRQTVQRDDLHVDLYPLARVCHLHVGLGDVVVMGFCR